MSEEPETMAESEDSEQMTDENPFADSKIYELVHDDEPPDVNSCITVRGDGACYTSTPVSTSRRPSKRRIKNAGRPGGVSKASGRDTRSSKSERMSQDDVVKFALALQGRISSKPSRYQSKAYLAAQEQAFRSFQDARKTHHLPQSDVDEGHPAGVRSCQVTIPETSETPMITSRPSESEGPPSHSSSDRDQPEDGTTDDRPISTISPHSILGIRSAGSRQVRFSEIVRTARSPTYGNKGYRGRRDLIHEDSESLPETELVQAMENANLSPEHPEAPESPVTLVIRSTFPVTTAREGSASEESGGPRGFTPINVQNSAETDQILTPKAREPSGWERGWTGHDIYPPPALNRYDSAGYLVRTSQFEPEILHVVDPSECERG